MVNKIDSLDAPVRTTLHLCSVLGSEFELFEIITVYQSWLQFDDSQKSYRAKLIMESLNAAVNEGIIEEIYEGGQLDDSEKAEGDVALAEDVFGEIMFASKQKKLDRLANISYRFHHDMWRENILRMMLDSRKRDLHRVIAESLDTDFSVGEEVKVSNYYSMIKLLRHRKLSGNATKTISLALEVGRSLINVCMSAQALKIFDEAIDMLRKNGKADCDDMDKVSGGESS
jgi:predicted ATPase